MDCVFCKIIRGDIPSNKVYEDENVLAFLDIAPVAKGHTLVIPKEHHVTVEETPEAVMAQVAIALSKVAKAVRLGTEAEGYTVWQSNMSAGGQVVPHLHFHIIPRFHNDGLQMWPQTHYDDGEAERYRVNIAKHL